MLPRTAAPFRVKNHKIMDLPRKRPVSTAKGSASKRLQRDDTLPLMDGDKSKQSSSKSASKASGKQGGVQGAVKPANDKYSIIVKNLDKNCDAIELLRLLSSEKAGAGNANFMVSFKTNVVSIQIPLDSSDKTKVALALTLGFRVRGICQANRCLQGNPALEQEGVQRQEATAGVGQMLQMRSGGPLHSQLRRHTRRRHGQGRKN